MNAAPRCAIAASISGTSCALSPEKLRATNVAPSCSASEARSIGSSVFATPRLLCEPLSAVAENCPFVRPYTPLFMTMYTMLTPRRMLCANWPRPIDAESPSPETPMYSRSRFARFAPVSTDGIRPCTLLKPCELPRKYVGVFDEQPIPDSFATLCGWMSRSKHAWMIAALIESWPQPAQSVDTGPS